MDPELLKLVQQAVRDGLSAELWVVVLVALIAAASGAYLGAYLKRKGENTATKEDFKELLRQIEAQTRATENIKAEVQRDLDTFGDTLERSREFAGFRRERIVKHMDQVLEAYIDIYSVSRLVGLEKWVRSNSDLKTQARFRTSLSRLQTHFGALVSLGAISKEDSGSFYDSDGRVMASWEKVLGEAAYRTPEFRAANPNSPEFSGQRLHEVWKTLMDQVEALGRVVKALSRNVTIPQ
jgi:hypothetical protein